MVNEPLSRKSDFFAKTATDGYITSAFLSAKGAAPTKRLMINESGIFGSFNDRDYNRDGYFKLLEKLIGGWSSY